MERPTVLRLTRTEDWRDIRIVIRSCAIYTRKSTEEGLDQAFNSLDAQREACENYILSQKAEGWWAVKTKYDDGGLSGGNMNRPALQALMQDIDDGKVDIVIVYKVDRLTRSLADFAKLVERFDKHEVSFVSVTQQFNTSNSMGRLTLNVLLSFAQFEREVGAERVRDKIAASRKKGLWTGGMPPLGYDVIDKTLIVNPKEAKTVQRLFELYLQNSCVRDVIDIAHAEGLRTKKRANGSGGRLITRGPLYWILSNPIYAGYVCSGDKLYKGVHQAIIDRDIWTATERKRAEAAQRLGVKATRKAPLVGKLFADGERLTQSTANKRGRRYRYYVTKVEKTGAAASEARWRLNAERLEKEILQLIDKWLVSDDAPQAILKDGATARQVLVAKAQLSSIAQSETDKLHNDRLSLWASRIARIDLSGEETSITNIPKHIFKNVSQLPLVDSCAIRSDALIDRSGQGLRLILGETENNAAPDKAFVRLVVSSFALKQRWLSEPNKSFTQLTNEMDLDTAGASRLVRFAFLAPDIVESILAGSRSLNMNAKALRRIKDLPVAWQDQRTVLCSNTS